MVLYGREVYVEFKSWNDQKSYIIKLISMCMGGRTDFDALRAS